MATGTQQTYTKAHTAVPVLKAVLMVILTLAAIGLLFIFLLSAPSYLAEKYDARISTATSSNTFSAFNNAPLNPSANAADRLAVDTLKAKLVYQMGLAIMYVLLAVLALLAFVVFISQLVRLSLIRRGQPLSEGESRKTSERWRHYVYPFNFLLPAGGLLLPYSMYQLDRYSESPTVTTDKGFLCEGLPWPECERLYSLPGTDVASEVMLAEVGIALMAIGAAAMFALQLARAARGKIW